MNKILEEIVEYFDRLYEAYTKGGLIRGEVRSEIARKLLGGGEDIARFSASSCSSTHLCVTGWIGCWAATTHYTTQWCPMGRRIRGKYKSRRRPQGLGPPALYYLTPNPNCVLSIPPTGGPATARTAR